MSKGLRDASLHAPQPDGSQAALSRARWHLQGGVLADGRGLGVRDAREGDEEASCDAPDAKGRQVTTDENRRAAINRVVAVVGGTLHAQLVIMAGAKPLESQPLVEQTEAFLKRALLALNGLR